MDNGCYEQEGEEEVQVDEERGEEFHLEEEARWDGDGGQLV